MILVRGDVVIARRHDSDEFEGSVLNSRVRRVETRRRARVTRVRWCLRREEKVLRDDAVETVNWVVQGEGRRMERWGGWESIWRRRERKAERDAERDAELEGSIRFNLSKVV